MSFKSNKLMMSEASKEKLNAQLETAEDWTGICRRCKAPLKGTLKQLREHKCGENS